MCNLLSHRTNLTFFDALNNFDLVYFLLFLPAFTHLFAVLSQQTRERNALPVLLVEYYPYVSKKVGMLFLRLDAIRALARHSPKVYTTLRVDDIPQQVADDIQGLRLDFS